MMSRPLVYIHAALTLLLPILVALLTTGCDPSIFGNKDKEQSLDYGPETSVDEISNALRSVFSQYDPNTMKVGEWAQLDETQQINNETFLLSDMAQNTVSRNEDDTTVTFTVTENRRYFDTQLNVTNKIDSEFPVVFSKATPPPSTASQTSSLEAPQKLGDPFYRISQIANQRSQDGSDGSTTLTLHNLQATKTSGTPPDAVANAPDCSTHYPNCQIRIYTISYDMVFWQNGKGNKLHREFKISPDVPYLGAILSECLTGVVPVQYQGHSQRIFVKQCTSAKNFRFGSG